VSVPIRVLIWSIALPQALNAKMMMSV